MVFLHNPSSGYVGGIPAVAFAAAQNNGEVLPIQQILACRQGGLVADSDRKSVV